MIYPLLLSAVTITVWLLFLFAPSNARGHAAEFAEGVVVLVLTCALVIVNLTGWLIWSLLA